MSRQMISPHISYVEATKSRTAIKRGIKNEPNPEQMEAMQHVALEVFEPVRNHFGKPIDINSFLRVPQLNQAIGGAASSQHCKGEALDLDGDRTGVSNKEIFNYIKDELLFDQLIYEFGTEENPAWVHVSRKKEGGNRRQVLQAFRDESGKTKYKAFDLW